MLCMSGEKSKIIHNRITTNRGLCMWRADILCEQWNCNNFSALLTLIMYYLVCIWWINWFQYGGRVFGGHLINHSYMTCYSKISQMYCKLHAIPRNNSNLLDKKNSAHKSTEKLLITIIADGAMAKHEKL